MSLAMAARLQFDQTGFAVFALQPLCSSLGEIEPASIDPVSISALEPISDEICSPLILPSLAFGGYPLIADFARGNLAIDFLRQDIQFGLIGFLCCLEEQAVGADDQAEMAPEPIRQHSPVPFRRASLPYSYFGFSI
jgi:hypothetical protein